MTKLEELERRVTALEEQIVAPRRGPRPGWLAHLIGSHADDPLFDEIARLGKELRDAEGFEDYAEDSAGGADDSCS